MEWLVCRRARDLALLSKEAILDAPHLAFAMALKDKTSVVRPAAGTRAAAAWRQAGGSGRDAARGSAVTRAVPRQVLPHSLSPSSVQSATRSPPPLPPGAQGAAATLAHLAAGGAPRGAVGATGRANILLEVTGVDSMVDARQLDSVVLSRAGPAATAPGEAAEAATGGATFGTPELPGAVVELRQAELGTPRMIEALNYVRAIRDGQVRRAVGGALSAGSLARCS